MSQSSTIEERLALVEKDVTELKSGFSRLGSQRNCNSNTRHLADVRNVARLPACKRLQKVLILTPPELIAYKVLSMIGRSKTPKGLMDAADLRRLVLRFPELKAEEGPVADALRRLDAPPQAFKAWQTLVVEEILPEDEDTGF